LGIFGQLYPALPLGQDAGGAVWHAQNAADDHLRPNRVQVFRRGIVQVRIALRHHHQAAVGGQGGLDGPD
jgi:hypothetical protein